MFPSHQRRDRSREEPVGFGSPVVDAYPSNYQQHQYPPQHQHQQAYPQAHSTHQYQQQQYPPQDHHYPPQTQQLSNHQAHTGSPRQEAGLDSSSNSNHSQTFPAQQPQAPYPKWTPPAPPPALSANFQLHNQYEYEQNRQPHGMSPQHQDDSGHGATLAQELTGPVPGQQSYEWKPPAALQAFQTSPDSSHITPTSPHQQTHEEHSPNNISPQFEEEQPVDDSGFTSFLSWAKLEDPVDIMDILMNDPAICSVTDIMGNTFLHSACDVGNISMVQFFLKNFPQDSAAALLTRNNQGFEPIHMAAFSGMLHVVGLLQKFDPSLVYRATRSGSTVLHLAVANSNFQLVDYLLDTLDDGTVWAVNSGGSNALHLACKFGNVSMIDRFSKFPGADVNFRNVVDETTCADLVCLNFDETMHLLVQSGAQLENTTALDLMGKTMKRFFGVTKVPAGATSKISPCLSHDSNDSLTGMSGSSPYSAHKLRKSGRSLLDDSSPVADRPTSSSSSSSSSSLPVTSPDQTGTRRKSSSYFPPANASFVPPPATSSTSKVTPPPKDGTKPIGKGKKIANPNSWIKSSSASVDDEDIVKVSAAIMKDRRLSEPGGGGASGEHDEGTEEDENPAGAGATAGAAATAAVVKKKVKEEPPAPAAATAATSVKTGSDSERLFKLVLACDIPTLESTLGVSPAILRDVNAVRSDKDSASLLHAAARAGSLDVAQFLVEGVGADVNALDGRNRSPLHAAVDACQLILVRYLVKYCGAVLDTKDVDGKVALDLLTSSPSEDRDEIERIIQKSAKKPPSKRMKVTIPKFSKP